MTHLPWLQTSRGIHHSPSGDMETLQTDVMRFMAILALSLMAIFALVQSIPLEPTDPRPRLESPEQLEREAKELEQRVTALRAEVTELQEAVRDARQSRDAAILQAEAAKDEAAALAAQARKVQASRDQAIAALQRVLQELENQQKRLVTVKEQVKTRQRSLARLRRDLETERRAVTRTERQVERIKREVEPDAAPAKPPVKPEPPSTPDKTAEQEGFSLRFASDAVLQSLIEKESVGFYAFVGKMLWRLSIRHGVLQFQPATAPRTYHEMTPSTVPASFIKALQRNVAVFGRERVIWGVTLPATTRSAIQRLMQGHKGGSLVIQSDGAVGLNGTG